MIGRFWRGWATAQHAQAYEELFRTSILPGLQRIDGFIGAYVLCPVPDRMVLPHLSCSTTLPIEGPFGVIAQSSLARTSSP